MIIPSFQRQIKSERWGKGYSGYLQREGRYQDPVYSLDFRTAEAWNDFLHQMVD
jgi:hypothetical protein